MDEGVKKTGRPCSFTQEKADRICEIVATHPVGMKRLHKMYPDEMPDNTCIYEWMQKYPHFARQYAKARLQQAQLLAIDCLDIADDASSDIKFNDDGEPIWDTDCINRARLKIDTRKWLAAKLLPRAYGKLAEEKDAEMNSLAEKIAEKILK